jgi:hypothetical protein
MKARLRNLPARRDRKQPNILQWPLLLRRRPKQIICISHAQGDFSDKPPADAENLVILAEIPSRSSRHIRFHLGLRRLSQALCQNQLPSSEISEISPAEISEFAPYRERLCKVFATLPFSPRAVCSVTTLPFHTTVKIRPLHTVTVLASHLEVLIFTRLSSFAND